MSVPAVDDSDSYNDLQIDFTRKNHTFNLDNVGYISKEHGKYYFTLSIIINCFYSVPPSLHYIFTIISY